MASQPRQDQPLLPQSDGKLERFHQTVKDHAVRPLTLIDLMEVKSIVGDFIEYYNTTSLQSPSALSPPNTSWKSGRRSYTKSAIKIWQKPAKVVNRTSETLLIQPPTTN